MEFLIDMNLSPRWCDVLKGEGWHSVHWSDVGVASASDREVMNWAFKERRIVLTHDLDFGAMLAATQAVGPSVVQVRTQDVRLKSMQSLLIPILRQYERELNAGALLVVEEAKSRVRLLPLANRPWH